MSERGVILCIDQGTTGTTALVLSHDLTVLAKANEEFPQHYPQPGWVEHDVEEIWSSVESSVTQALKVAKVGADEIVAIGITNQRETSVIWDRETSAPIHRAVVWQCRRTTAFCEGLIADGHTERVRAKTGLVLDPYFSATKARWTLDHVDGARARAERGELAFGTIDTYLIWRLTASRVHVTDVTNASRTLLMDIHAVRWDEELLELFDVPQTLLADIKSSSEIYGHTEGLDFLPDGIPIAGIAGDQQAALFGQACFSPGDVKSTYGTGAFVLMNVGQNAPLSEHGLLTTIACKVGEEPVTYALEGSVFIAGAAVQWLRDELQIIERAPEIEALARSVADNGGVSVIPAFAGLGAPYWDPEARGAIIGLTRGSNRGHIARATLEGIAHQVADVVAAMSADSRQDIGVLKVDGGAAANGLLMQVQADLLNATVSRSAILETTALGSGLLAGLATGFWGSQQEVVDRWREDGRFEPMDDTDNIAIARAHWARAVERVRH